MGAGIAFVAAQAGYAVDLIEPAAAAQDTARARIEKQALRAHAPDAPSRVNYYAELQSGTQAVLAIEAVPERLDLKRELFRAFEQRLGAQTLLATNTSSLSVGNIAEVLEHPERVLGLHFFNPPAAMQLVEIVRAEQTSDETIAQARTIVQRLGKTAVIAEDTPGFIVNRVARPFYLQAMRAYDAGAAPFEDLDRLARGIGFRMGPFELMDLIGLDVNLATSESVYERTEEDRLKPVALQRELVAQGRLGRKSGAGFYNYANGAPPHRDELPQPPAQKNTDEKIAVIGFAGVAQELHDRLLHAYADVGLWEDEESIGGLPQDVTIVFDTGDGASDRSAVIAALDEMLPPQTIVFVDAYASDVAAMSRRLHHPERVVGYGILASLENQRCVEIVDAESTGDDALELAQETFEAMGRRVVLVEDRPGLFLGRTIGSIVNEAVAVVEQGVASAGDVDLAMKLGTNYPLGPIEWGREIGGDRIERILQRLATVEGKAFAPHRALWVLDVQEEGAVINE